LTAFLLYFGRKLEYDKGDDNLEKGKLFSGLLSFHGSLYTVKKLERSKQAVEEMGNCLFIFSPVNRKAWDIRRGQSCLDFFGFQNEIVMIKRDSWSDLYFLVRGEICRPRKDKQMRKRVAKMRPLIKNESKGIEGD